MLEIISFDASNKQLLSVSLHIRNMVFVKEQGIDAHLEFDEFDGVSKHYLVYDKDIPIATGRWRKTSEGVKLERYAVIPSWRNQGIGQELLGDMLDDTLPLELKIYVHAQIGAVPFYKKNGFEIEGKTFYEAGILHNKMVYKFD
ncbi:MAG: GNAT family N-acetyltransferase [Bacteroidota bacterium]